MQSGLRQEFGAWMLGTLIGVLLLVWSLAFVIHRHVQRIEVANAQREVAAVAALIADHTDRSFQGVDLVLRLLVERVEHAFAHGEQDPARLHEVLREAVWPLPQLRGAMVLDAAGNSIGDAAASTPRPFNGADRAFFALHRDDPSRAMSISDPFRGRVTGLWLIALSRRFDLPDGSFGGIVVASMEPAFLAALYDVLDPRHGTTITLVKGNGVVFATTHKQAERFLGSRLADGIIDPSRLSAGGHGLLAGRSPFNGSDRIGAFYKAQAYDMFVVVGRDRDVVTAWSVTDSRTIFGVAGILSLLCAAIAFGIGRDRRSLQRRLREGVERMPDGFILWDREGRLVIWNSQLERLLPEARPFLRKGDTLEAITRRLLPLLRQTSDESELERILARRLEVFRSPGAPWDMKLSDGRMIEVEEQRTADGGVVSVYRDKTERGRQQAALESALVAERAAKELGLRFIAMAGHEFRTPLAIIDGSAQRLVARVPRDDPEIGRRLVRIRDAVARMNELIERTLSSVRVEEGGLKLRCARIDLATLLERCIERQSQISTEFRIVVTGVAAPLHVQGDERLLEQVFSNLLSNAVKYSGSARRIEVTLGDVPGDPGSVRVAVRDHGIGIPAAELPKIFTRYFRASTAANIPGTGIGLDLVREIVGLHGGAIAVESELDVGTTLTVTLPREGAAVRPERATASR